MGEAFNSETLIDGVGVGRIGVSVGVRLGVGVGVGVGVGIGASVCVRVGEGVGVDVTGVADGIEETIAKGARGQLDSTGLIVTQPEKKLPRNTPNAISILRLLTVYLFLTPFLLT